MIFKKKKGVVVEPPIDLNAVGGSGPDNRQREIASRQTEAIVPTKELLYDAVIRRADRVMLDFTRDAMAGRYMIDGVWHNVEPRDRETADAMLVVLKTVAGLNPEERRARQVGKFQIEHQVSRSKYNGEITSQGVKTGERVIIELAPKKAKKFKTLDDVGMREQLQERLREHMRAE